MRKLILVLIIFMPIQLLAQPNALAWQQNLNSGNLNYTGGASCVSNTNFIFQSVGYFGLTDVDPTAGIDTVNGQGVFLTKYNHEGQYLGSKIFPNALGGLLKLDHDNNILISGDFTGTVDFNPDPIIVDNRTAVGANYNYFVLKLDSNGIFLWVNTFSKLKVNGYKNALAIDSENKIIVCGSYNDSLVDFDPGIGTTFLSTANNITQGFKLTINSNGTFNNVKQLVSSNFIRLDGCVIDPNDNVYITGEYTDSVDFNTTSNNTWLVNSTNSKERFICKFNSADSLIFVKNFGEISYNKSARQEIYIKNFDIFILGNIDTIVDFDPDSTINWDGDSVTQNGYLLKLDSNGVFKWVICNKRAINNSQNVFSYLAFDNLNNIHVAGLSTTVNAFDTLDLDPSAAVSEFRYTGQNAMFHVCYSNAGNLVFMMPVDTIGATFTNSGGWALTDLTILPNNSLVYTGEVFMISQDIDIGDCTYNITTATGVSMIACYTTCQPSLTEINIIACDSAFLNGAYYNRDTSLLMHYTNAICCDSNIKYTITITKIDTSITQTSAGLQANTVNATYQWVQCPNFTPIAGATAQTYNPTQAGKYAVIINKGNCVDTSNCYNTYNLGLQNAIFKACTLLKTFENNWIFNVPNTALLESNNLCIYNNVGQKVLEKTILQTHTNIELNHFAKGLYIAQFGGLVQKIFVE